MGDNSSIEWTDATWNPTIGCSIVSPGCTNCYAMRQAARVERMIPDLAHYKGVTQPSKAGPVWTGRVMISHPLVDTPLRWKKPRRIFVNSMSDLFHEGVPDVVIDQVFAIMALTPRHTYQVLTKRAERMRAYMKARWHDGETAAMVVRACAEIDARIPMRTDDSRAARDRLTSGQPLPNVWLGVSAEDQRRADERIPLLLNTPAAVRWVSAEPLLGPLDLRAVRWGHATALTRLHWVVPGGESGPHARPAHPDWFRTLRDQCTSAGVPFFFKQWGAWTPFIDRDKDDPDWRQDYTVAAVRPHQFRILNLAGGCGFHGERVHLMKHASKAAAGAQLDGREWREFPT